MYPVMIEIDGVRHNLTEWAQIKGIKYSTLVSRVAKGYPTERLFEPTKRPKVDKTSPEWKAHWAEYMRKYRADPINKERIKEQQSACYYNHLEQRIAYKRKKDAERKQAKLENKAK